MDKKLDGMSMDLELSNKERLKEVFPECFNEDKLDIDKLLSLCGEYIDNDFEKYKFEWKGKSECLRIAQKRSAATLRLCPNESVDFDITGNLYIEGDNLEVLKLLQTAYFRKVKMIYIDPPYNTGNDFVYKDDFADPMARYKEITSQTTKSNPETMGRYHTNWLNMMYPRLRLASNLLRDDGVIFISIDDNEVHNLRKLCDEVFGEENFVTQINWKGRGGRQDSKHFAAVHEYILCYAKSLTEFKAGEDLKIGDIYPKYDENQKRNYKTQLARKWGSNSKRTDRPNLYYSITAPDGSELYPMAEANVEGCWRWSKQRMADEIKNGNVEFSKNKDGKWVAYEKIWEPVEGEMPTKKYTTWIDEINDGADIIKEYLGKGVFDYPKSIKLLQRFIKMADVADNDLILDFFSGSATTAHAVMQLNAEDGGNRKFIMVQIPELCDEKSEAYKAGYKNICEIGKERIRRAGAKIKEDYIQSVIKNNIEDFKQGKAVADFVESPENLKTAEELNSKLDTGFKVFKLDTSNLAEWDGTPIQDHDLVTFSERMNKMIDAVKPDRSDMDVVTEVMLKMGVPLDIPVSFVDINGKTSYSVGDFLLLICLAKDITAEDIETMCCLAPGKIVIADSCFADSVVMSNAYYILKDHNIELKLV